MGETTIHKHKQGRPAIAQWPWILFFISLVIVGIQWINPQVSEAPLNLEVYNWGQPQALQSQWFYLIVNGLTILFPILLSFDRRVAFYKKWPKVWKAIFIPMLLFIPWDIYFTHLGVWGFNSDLYQNSLKLLGLPLGEWLFFITVPYACLFLYECMEVYFPTNFSLDFSKKISLVLLGILIGLSVIFFNQLYTSSTVLLLIGFLFLIQWKIQINLSSFYRTFILVLLPFLIVDSLLTGILSPAPLVCYNELEKMTFRILSIPVEDFIYGLLLLMLNVSIYKRF